ADVYELMAAPSTGLMTEIVRRKYRLEKLYGLFPATPGEQRSLWQKLARAHFSLIQAEEILHVHEWERNAVSKTLESDRKPPAGYDGDRFELQAALAIMADHPDGPLYYLNM